jgi:hypothetical protein
MKRGLFALGLLALQPPMLAAQFAGGPKPIPRPDGPYSVSGIIVNGMTGMPIPGADIAISIGPQGIGPVFEIAESAADGGFRFSRLPEGKYTLKAERRGFAGQAYLQHENYWSAIAVGPGKDSQHVRFPLYPSAVIAGQATDENGEGVRDATVKLWKRVYDSGKPDVEMNAQVMTDDRGMYRFDHLAAGKYAVSVRATPWYTDGSAIGQGRNQVRSASFAEEGDEEENTAGIVLLPGRPTGLPDVVYPPVYYPRGNDLSAANWFELQPGEEEAADFQLSPVPGIHLILRVNDNGGKWAPFIEEVEGDSQNTQGDHSYGTVISPGVVEFTGLAPGKYRLNLPKDEASYRENEDVEISSDSEFDFRQSTPPAPKWTAEIRLSGNLDRNAWGALQLRSETGSTFSAPAALLVDKTDGSGDVNRGGANGVTLIFQPAPPEKGEFEVGLTLPVGGTIESLEATGATVSGHRITTEGGEVHLKIKAFVSEISLYGTAKKNGQPFAGAMMLLLPENGASQLVRRDQSDSDGTFALPNVVPGKYKLLALEHGWEMPWADPEQRKALLTKGMTVEISKATASGPVIVEVQ